jgi:hypothetical protein
MTTQINTHAMICVPGLEAFYWVMTGNYGDYLTASYRVMTANDGDDLTSDVQGWRVATLIACIAAATLIPQSGILTLTIAYMVQHFLWPASGSQAFFNRTHYTLLTICTS